MYPFKGGEKVMNKDMIEINDQTNKGEIKMKKMKRILKNEKGLTLIELLAVIVILAIVAAIAVPAISNIIAKQEDKAILANASMILSGAKLAAANGECGSEATLTCDEVTLLDYIESTDITDADNISASKTADIWTITYNELDGREWNIDAPTVGTGGTITEIELLDSMGN